MASIRRDVRDTPELRRILALPERPLSLSEAKRDAAAWTELLALKPYAVLRAWQGFILRELLEGKHAGGYGVYAGLPVGAGKTLIFWLACVILDALRPLLLVPGSLEKKTRDDFRSYLGVWRAPKPPPRIMTFETLRQTSNVDFLLKFKPDLLMLDESDGAKDQTKSLAKRIDRCVLKHEPQVLMGTGTPARESLYEVAHHLKWILGNRCPLPVTAPELREWAGAVDLKKNRGLDRVGAGALRLLGSDGSLHSTRKAVWRRLSRTPGVVIVDGDSCDQPLTITQVLAPEDKKIDQAYYDLRVTWTTPDGWPLAMGGDKKDALAYARHAYLLGGSVYLYWDPRPPERWVDARRAYAKGIKAAIEGSEYSKFPLDTELAARNANKDEPWVTDWLRIKPSYWPPSYRDMWLSGSALQAAHAWIKANGPVVVFCGNVCFGEALAKSAGIEYYGPGGWSESGKYIDNAPATRSAVTSIRSNLRGRNLQKIWHKALIIYPPTSAKDLEQLMGRIHRSGQTKPVEIYVFCTSGDVLDAFERAILEARHGRTQFGLTQKILRAKIVRATPRITESNRYRWARKTSNNMTEAT